MATTAKGIPGITGGNNWNLETDWQNTINAVDNLLDARGTAAQRAAALAGVPVGTHWQDTDGIRMLWRKDGAAWVPAVWNWGGTTSQMNGFTEAPEGFEWWNTTVAKSYTRKSGAWVAGTQTQALALSIGVAASGFAGPSVTLSGGVATLVGRINNGNNLTLTASFQQVATLPPEFRPSGSVVASATNASTSAAIVQVTSSGAFSVAAPGSVTVTFAFSYPVG